MDGHSKGKGPLKMYESEEPKPKKQAHQEKIGLIVGGYVLARPHQDAELYLAQITDMKPNKASILNFVSIHSP